MTSSQLLDKVKEASAELNVQIIVVGDTSSSRLRRYTPTWLTLFLLGVTLSVTNLMFGCAPIFNLKVENFMLI